MPAHEPLAAASPAVSGGKPTPLLTLGDAFFWIHLYPVQFLGRFIPPAAIYWIAGIAEPLMQFRMRRQKERAIRWMVACGCAPPQRAPGIARQFIFNRSICNLDELILLRPDCHKLLHCTVEGAEHFSQARGNGKGVILLAGHFGANRAGTKHLTATACPILSVHNRHPSNQGGRLVGRRLLRRFIEIRQRANPDVVYIQDPECGLKILRRLRGGGVVKIQMDGVAGGKSVESRFLGIPWRVPTGIFEIIRLSGCAVIPMLCLGGPRDLRIHFGPALPLEHAVSREEFLSAYLPLFMQAIEKQVMDHPEEWKLWAEF